MKYCASAAGQYVVCVYALLTFAFLHMCKLLKSPSHAFVNDVYDCQCACTTNVGGAHLYVVTTISPACWFEATGDTGRAHLASDFVLVLAVGASILFVDQCRLELGISWRSECVYVGISCLIGISRPTHVITDLSYGYATQLAKGGGVRRDSAFIIEHPARLCMYCIKLRISCGRPLEIEHIICAT